MAESSHPRPQTLLPHGSLLRPLNQQRPLRPFRWHRLEQPLPEGLVDLGLVWPYLDPSLVSTSTLSNWVFFYVNSAVSLTIPQWSMNHRFTFTAESPKTRPRNSFTWSRPRNSRDNTLNISPGRESNFPATWYLSRHFSDILWGYDLMWKICILLVLMIFSFMIN